MGRIYGKPFVVIAIDAMSQNNCPMKYGAYLIVDWTIENDYNVSK